MIAHLTGTLLEKHVQRLVVDVGGVGYDVQVPLSTFYAVGDPGARIALRIHTHVREDALQLFGFLTPLELTMFERLLSVQGIGPKVALSVLSGIEPGDLVRAIRNSDVARLVKIPGVGRKTGERLVLELKDRLPDAAAPIDDAPVEGGDLRDDVLSALGNLGYQRIAAEKSVDRVLKSKDAPETFEALLRDVLKVMAG
ncbi:MAG TPA: Holliday junction branch migration protein RuvA [Vicinamibacterales bacterium]|nr:Holliday junction branch migration protein RuvA [Vicinamibacterales bacterium]